MDTLTSVAIVPRVHLLVDFWGGSCEMLECSAGWVRLLTRAAEAGGATVLVCHAHQFWPVGVTAYAPLSQSHLSAHTYPETRLATLDLYTCGPIQTDAILDTLRQALRPERESIRRLERG